MPAIAIVLALFRVAGTMPAFSTRRKNKRGVHASTLVGTGLLGAMALCAPSPAQAIERNHCEEQWFNQSIENSEHHPDSTTPCQRESAAFKPLGRFYWLAHGKAYFRNFETRRSSPCSGKGVGALGNLLNPVCYLPGFLQVHHNHETRRFWLASTDGAHFRLATTRHVQPLSPWQTMMLARYAVDEKHAYLNGERLVGADVGTFEVVFPFGDDERWRAFEFARDRDQVFVEKWALPLLELSQVQWLPLPCAEDVPQWQLESCRNQPVHTKSRLGRTGNKLLFLSYGDRPALLEGLVAPDLQCLDVGGRVQCRSHGRIHEIAGDFDNPPTVRVMTEQQVRQSRQ